MHGEEEECIVGKPEGNRPLGGRPRHGRIILKWMVEK
jgi:hypothetical protein